MVTLVVDFRMIFTFSILLGVIVISGKQIMYEEKL